MTQLSDAVQLLADLGILPFILGAAVATLANVVWRSFRMAGGGDLKHGENWTFQDYLDSEFPTWREWDDQSRNWDTAFDEFNIWQTERNMQ